MSRLADISERLTAWAPAIVLADLAIAVAAFASGLIPPVIIYILASATAIAALLVAVRRAMAIGFFRTGAQLGFHRNRDAIVYDLLNRGMHRGAFGLAIACFLGALLSGFRPPQIVLVFGAGTLSAAWTAATRRWPYEEAGDGANKVDSGSSPG
jgi:hypothetical protein